MTINQFKIRLKDINGFSLSDDVYFFKKPCIIIDAKNDKDFHFKTVDEALDHEINGEKVSDIIHKMEYLPIPSLDGKIDWKKVFRGDVKG